MRGVGDDFWATFVDPEPDNPKKRIMTVWGQGTININAANAQTLLAIVVRPAVRRLAELCTDPHPDAGVPRGRHAGQEHDVRACRSSARASDFVDMMQGKGMLGPFLTQLQRQARRVQEPEGPCQTSITLKSKRFSIYADGIVPGYKRTTKVRIHAVVDFVHAGALGPTGA